MAEGDAVEDMIVMEIEEDTEEVVTIVEAEAEIDMMTVAAADGTLALVPALALVRETGMVADPEDSTATRVAVEVSDPLYAMPGRRVATASLVMTAVSITSRVAGVAELTPAVAIVIGMTAVAASVTTAESAPTSATPGRTEIATKAMTAGSITSMTAAAAVTAADVEATVIAIAIAETPATEVVRKTSCAAAIGGARCARCTNLASKRTATSAEARRPTRLSLKWMRSSRGTRRRASRRAFGRGTGCAPVARATSTPGTTHAINVTTQP